MIYIISVGWIFFMNDRLFALLIIGRVRTIDSVDRRRPNIPVGPGMVQGEARLEWSRVGRPGPPGNRAGRPAGSRQGLVQGGLLGRQGKTLRH